MSFCWTVAMAFFPDGDRVRFLESVHPQPPHPLQYHVTLVTSFAVTFDTISRALLQFLTAAYACRYSRTSPGLPALCSRKLGWVEGSPAFSPLQTFQEAEHACGTFKPLKGPPTACHNIITHGAYLPRDKNPRTLLSLPVDINLTTPPAGFLSFDNKPVRDPGIRSGRHLYTRRRARQAASKKRSAAGRAVPQSRIVSLT